MKVLTFVGTRPELIKLSAVIKHLDQHVNHVLVHAGQNYDYELNAIFFEDMDIRKPDYFLECAQDTPSKTVADVIQKTDDLLAKEKPDAFLILGDTNSCLCVYAAKRHQIPVFHMEAGNRCFDERVPEEINRRLLDHISDVNLVYTEHARRYLINEGLPSELIIKTGSPMLELYQAHSNKIEGSTVLKQLKLEDKKFFIVSAHREENVDYLDNLQNLIETLNVIAERYHMPVIVSTHPRTRQRLSNINGQFGGDIRFLPPLSFTDYVKLQQRSFCAISDSGTITEESSILGFPAVMIRKAHERPEGMDEGTLIMSGLKPEDVCHAINVVTAHPNRVTNIVSDYDTSIVSHKVLRIILSYTDYVNRRIWHKHI